MDGRPAADPPAGPAPEPGDTLDPDRVVLGRALQARAEGVGHLVDEQYTDALRGEAFATSRLATELIGRWLATDQAATSEEITLLARQGEQAILFEAELCDVAKAYFTWRDACSAALVEEAARLGSPEELVETALAVVRFSCDGSLVRIIRQFDATRRALQERLREEQATLAHQALHDQLTGLPNRTLLLDRLRQATQAADRRSSRAILLFLDLDNFKAINDRFGHPAGDALLVEVARRLRDLVRGSDTVARLGGDEFVVLADDLGDPEAASRALAERIHRALRPPVVVGDRELHTSVSIGFTQVAPFADPEVCLSRADAAMFHAKRGGPARHEGYTEDIGQASRRQSQLADELRVAHGLGQLSVHYQPLFQLGGELSGMEALLRWCHPELGNVRPDEFIPLLEQSREIVVVGRWVLLEAARQCRVWQDEGRSGLTMSVNVSAVQLQDPDFVRDVETALRESDLEPGYLVLEVTETALVLDIARIGATMQQVRDLGVHFALDDFGTGYSSLLYLRGLPIDRLKVDRSFVSGLGSAGQDPTIVSTVVELAHRLGLRVVAEGVETQAELDAVEAMGCDEAQGFLLGRPGPASSHTFDAQSGVLTRS